MRNIQISFDENIIREVDQVASSSQTTRSAVIRQAIKYWLREREIREFERDWISCLVKKPDDSKDTEEWMKAQEWSKK